MKEFSKRIYHNPGEFWRDLKFLMERRQEVSAINNGQIINPEFRQRLMMAVTVVNGCRYCSYYHTRLSLKAGVGSDELQALLDGRIDSCPDEELLALLYAQHWAENDGKADSDFQEKLVAEYGAEKARAIGLTLRTIRFGNLSGNTFDYLIYRISFGRLAGNN